MTLRVTFVGYFRDWYLLHYPFLFFSIMIIEILWEHLSDIDAPKIFLQRFDVLFELKEIESVIRFLPEHALNRAELTFICSTVIRIFNPLD